MTIRLAFIGFRHGHIYDLYRRAQEMDGIEVVAACEEDPAARAAVRARGDVTITHDSAERLLAEVECDAVAVCDYFAKRGSLVIRALQHGRHVISDKPLCTRLEELDEIEALATAKGLKVGCMFDLRDSPNFIGLRDRVRQGLIGEVQAIAFGGQHPLNLGTRPGWYFEPGKHGGTLNDIAVHAVDAIPWLTGLSFATINAARCWNAFAREYPHFQDSGHVMLTLSNGAGVLGDASYSMPDSMGHVLPQYWRMTLFGRQGVLETSYTMTDIFVALNGEPQPRHEAPPAGNPGGYLKAFLNDIAGHATGDDLHTQGVLQTARVALLIQHAADTGERDIALTRMTP